MANQLILGRALDENGYILPGAKATVYADGTSTLITIYSDVDGTIPATNPFVADGNGFWPQRYVSEGAKVAVTDANDVPLYTLDPAPTSQGTGAAAANISFSPTLDIPQTNVQAAIERAGQLAVSGFAAFGLGITGNATLLANLDATGTGAGVYRFDGTTTGTFPTGVAAGDTGMVELWRQAGATAMMELHHATSNRVFRRRMTASTWGAWREVPNVNQATAEGDLIYRGASDFARLAKGTAGQVLRMNSGATAPEWGGAISLQASQASTSGTEVSFSGIPAAVKRVTLLLNKVSLSGSDHFLVQLGTSGGPVTTGYTSWGSAIAGSAVGGGNSASGVRIDGATGGASGRFVAERLAPGSNIWVCTFNGVRLSALPSTPDASYNSGGEIDLGAELTQIRLTRSGSNTFDSGTVGASWES